MFISAPPAPVCPAPFPPGEWTWRNSRRLRHSGYPLISPSNSNSTRSCSPVTWLRARTPDSRQCCRSRKALGGCWPPESKSSPLPATMMSGCCLGLAARIDGFTLLGAGGEWEARTISKDGSPVAQVVGWSFGDWYVRESPVAQLLRQPLRTPRPLVPRIGLLHADLDASGGHHAPVTRAELDDTGYDAWLLGHVHKPSLEGLSASTGTRPCGYLGSLVGLDPSETGPHGPLAPDGVERWRHRRQANSPGAAPMGAGGRVGGRA